MTLPKGTVLLLIAISMSPLSAEITAVGQRKPAPPISLTDAAGARFSLSDYKGKVVLLDFWATWCGGCKTEIPWFMDFSNKYKQDGLAVIGVSMDDEGWRVVRPFITEKKINYRIVVGDDDLGKLYSVDSMPMTLLIDRDGKVAASHIGVVDKEVFENELRSLLKDVPSGNKSPSAP